MNLYLLRHAHTEKAKGNTTDFERQIDEKGQEQLTEMKGYLKENYADVPFQVYCSPATRTKTTFQNVKTAMNVVHEEYVHELYLPSRDNLLHFLWNADQKTDDVMIIAHNNGISEIASYLLNQSTMLPTCGLVVLTFEGINKLSEISQGTAIEKDSFLPQ